MMPSMTRRKLMLMPLILAMLPALVVANPAGASGPEDGLESDVAQA